MGTSTQPHLLALISGGETGGSKKHLLSLLAAIQPYIPVRLACLLDGPLYREAVALGVPALLLSQKSRRDLSILPRLEEELAAGVNIVHSHGGRANFVADALRRRSAHPGVAWISTVHSDPGQDYVHQPLWKRVIFTALNVRALRGFDHWIAVSHDFRRRLERYGLPAGSISVVYNGIDYGERTPEQYWEWRASPEGQEERARVWRELAGWELTDRDRVVGMVARLHPVKEHETLLRAARELIAEGQPLYIPLIGDGPLREQLKQRVRDLGLEGRVALLGHREDAAELLAHMDAEVLCSRTESFPYVILEAARAATPVLSTPVGGIPDLVPRDCLYPVGDAAALRQLLHRLLTEPGELRRQGLVLGHRAREQFTLERMARDHLDIYRHLLAERGR